MKNILVKDGYRDIKKSLGRFMSIVAIVALGVAFFYGLKIAPIDMKKTADNYYDEYNFMDMRIVSTLGITDNDVKVIKNIDGVEGVFPTYSMDVLTKYKSEEMVIKVHAIESNKMKNNKDYINKVKLIKGRLPKQKGEVVIEKNDFNGLNIPIGTKLILSSGTDKSLSESLDKTQVEVVGIIETPYYLSVEKGSSSIGNGMVKMFMMMPQEDFKMDVYTEAFVTVKNAKEANSYDDKYFDIVNKVKDKIENISDERIEVRYKEVLDEATSELNKAKDEYQSEKDKALKELNDAKQKLDNGKNDILKSEKELKNQQTNFNNTVKNAEYEITKGEKQLKQGEKDYALALKSFNNSKPAAQQAINNAEIELNKAQQTINTLNIQLENIKNSINDEELPKEEKDKLQIEYNALSVTIDNSINQLNSGKKELENKKNQLYDAEKTLKDSKAKLDSSKVMLSNKKAELEKGKKQSQVSFKEGKAKIEKGKIDLEKGNKEYEESKVKAEEEFLKAENKIKDAEDEISKIEKPEWFILDRNQHFSYVDYKNSADSINSLAAIFPVIFFLVAALVCLTTMTRMVDEQRINIGTLKGLGYNKISIAAKFIIYALLATLIGSLIGLAIGGTIFPIIIFNAHTMRYTLQPVILEFNIPIAIFITLVAILVTTLAAYFSCNNELKESTSALMRPKAPKEGKTILLEKIPFIWKRLNFTGKVTVRNIFRYKKRFLMTVLGIAGCTALLLTGFGIKDSIKTIVDKQFEAIFKYDMTINLDKKIGTKEKKDLENILSNNKNIKDYDFIKSEPGKVSYNKIEKDIKLIVPNNLDKFDKLIRLQERKSKNNIKLQNGGVVISEKIATQLNVKVNDEIVFINSNDKKIKVKISGVAENYVFNYIYISPSYYKEVFGRNEEYNSIIANTENLNQNDEDILSKDLISKSGVSGVAFNSSLKNNFNDTIKSLNYVVLLMIVSAGSLAFVVLYNLTNVNISERIREIATIKVLGFYDNEVSAYIYRENLILTFIGTIVGLGFGVLLHGSIISTVELDSMMFGRQISVLSFILSALLTVLFAVIVNLAMYYKLKNVNMIESLKSVD